MDDLIFNKMAVNSMVLVFNEQASEILPAEYGFNPQAYLFHFAFVYVNRFYGSKFFADAEAIKQDVKLQANRLPVIEV